MEQRSERRKLGAAQVVSRTVKIIMVVLYIALGTTIIFKAVDISNVDPLVARIFGIFMILYGIIRGYQVYRNYYSASETDEE